MSWSGFFKFFLGFLIAIALLVGGGVAVALYFVTKLTTPPPKPVFANDKPAIAQTKSSPVASKPTAIPPTQLNAASTPTATTVAVQSSPSPSASATPTPEETPSPKPLEPGAYRGRVTWPDGLIVRNAPGTEAERIGGIAYNQQVVIVSESDDKRWIKVRVEENNQEGWVKAGNVKRDDGEQTQTSAE
jgi:Bacterial SH3 domain